MVLKVSGDFEQWYYDELTPWKHYIPVSRTMDELPEIVNYLQQNDSHCHEIAQQGAKFIENINYKETATRTVRLIKEILKAQIDANAT